jgi:hypothetical protein
MSIASAPLPAYPAAAPRRHVAPGSLRASVEAARRSRGRLERGQGHPASPPDAKDLGKGSSRPRRARAGSIKEGGGHVGAGKAGGSAYPPRVMDGRAGADVLVSLKTLPAPSSPLLSPDETAAAAAR